MSATLAAHKEQHHAKPLEPSKRYSPSLSSLPLAAHVRAAEQPTETVAVSKTYNNAPFDYHIRLLAERPQFRVYRLTYPSPVVTPLAQNNTIPADYYVPNGIRPGDAKCPAVICLHILDGNEPLTDLVCSVLASRGIPAISFKLPYYGSRGTAKGPEALADDPKLFVGAIAQAGEDIRRTIDLLASRPEINPERIGITGISLGGIIAAAAAGAEPRLHRAGLILGRRRSAADHPSRPRNPRPERDAPKAAAGRAGRGRSEDRGGRSAAVRPRPARAGPGRPRADDQRRRGRSDSSRHAPRNSPTRWASPIASSGSKGLGHYTAMAELPRALRMTADFFAQDLPEGVARIRTSTLGTEVPSPAPLAAARRRSCSRPSRCWRPSRQAGPLPSASIWNLTSFVVRPTCGSFAARKASSCSSANCRKSARSRWAKAAFPGCSPAARPCWPARRIPSRITTCSATSSRGT